MFALPFLDIGFPLFEFLAMVSLLLLLPTKHINIFLLPLFLRSRDGGQLLPLPHNLRVKTTLRVVAFFARTRPLILLATQNCCLLFLLSQLHLNLSTCRRLLIGPAFLIGHCHVSLDFCLQRHSIFFP
jgi:hypothetical protein